ncbi:MAG: shikimate dehydrogenase, partial [Promethearchaeota archaeon]
LMHNIALRDLNLNYVYVAFDILPENLKKALDGIRVLNIKGINVTIPHKRKIINYLDQVDPIAKKIGAVNTIKNENGFLIGKNTDAIGAKLAIKDAHFKIKGKKVLILGAGGASRAIAFSLASECKSITIANRTLEKAIQLVDDLSQITEVVAKCIEFKSNIIEEVLESVDLLVNTTPIGMYPKIDDSPLPKRVLRKDLFVFDVIYNPYVTKLLHYADEMGCKTLNGLDMLVNQGSVSFEWWTGVKPKKNLMKEILKRALKK